MLIQTLRTLLKSKSIAKERNLHPDYVRQIVAGHKEQHLLDRIEYDVAGDVLLTLKERHDNYVIENFPAHNVEEERKIFLENNTK